MSTHTSDDLDIHHDADAQRFTASLPGDGEVGHLDYTADAVTMTVRSTVVDPRFGGRGFAAKMAREALDYAQEQGWQVVPQCSYIGTFVDRNPQYAELIVD
ncbi:GNAT family N-acetyltransferase [Rarobacter incanus]|nr:GNAT family N-acetyltransferase [Rarobacter incanus]